MWNEEMGLVINRTVNGDDKQTTTGSESLVDSTIGNTSWTTSDEQEQINQFYGLLKVSVVLLLSPIIICSNFLILVALYRYKRLRTASNYFIASLACSDLGAGLCLPIIMFVQSSKKIDSSFVCLLPQCVAVSLCSASVLTMAAIAVDRFTSLAQPLKYNNMMTRTSVHRYIALYWIYSLIVGFIPLLYWSQIASDFPEDCTLATLLNQPMQIFLICAVYGPSALILLGCYGYIYVIARYHARAIYTVESSLRQHQDCAHSRYGQTLAITVGLFICFWMPYQILVIQDIVRGTSILRKWLSFYFALPLYVSSAVNPWIYGYKNTEIRMAVYKVTQDFMKCTGYKTSRYACPVNVMVASAVNAEHAVAELNSKTSAARIQIPGGLSPMKYTSFLMSTLRGDSERSSTATSICRLETTACLGPDFNNMLELNGNFEASPC